jgi:hypothetical protein
LLTKPPGAVLNGEAGPQGSALALLGLQHDLDVGPDGLGPGDGVVGGAAVHEDDLVDVGGKALQDPADVLGLVHGGDHHAHPLEPEPPLVGQIARLPLLQFPRTPVRNKLLTN